MIQQLWYLMREVLFHFIQSLSTHHAPLITGLSNRGFYYILLIFLWNFVIFIILLMMGPFGVLSLQWLYPTASKNRLLQLQHPIKILHRDHWLKYLKKVEILLYNRPNVQQSATVTWTLCPNIKLLPLSGTGQISWTIFTKPHSTWMSSTIQHGKKSLLNFCI